MTQLAMLAIKQGSAFVLENPALAAALIILYQLSSKVTAKELLATWVENGLRYDFFDESFDNKCHFQPHHGRHTERDCMKFLLSRNDNVTIGVDFDVYGGHDDTIARYGRPCWNQRFFQNFFYKYTMQHDISAVNTVCDPHWHAPAQHGHGFPVEFLHIHYVDSTFCDEFTNNFESIVITCVNALYDEDHKDNSIPPWRYVAIIVPSIIGVLAAMFGAYKYYQYRQRARGAAVPVIIQGEPEPQPEIELEVLDLEAGPNKKRIADLVENIITKITELKEGIENGVTGEVSEQLAPLFEKHLVKLQADFDDQHLKFCKAFGLEGNEEGSIWQSRIFDDPVQVVLEDGSLSEQVYERAALDSYIEQQRRLNPLANLVDPKSGRLAQIEVQEDGEGQVIIKVKETEIKNPVTLFVREGVGELVEVKGVFEDNRVGEVHPFTGHEIVKTQARSLELNAQGRSQPFLIKKELQRFMDAHIEQLKKLEQEIDIVMQKNLENAEQKSPRSPRKGEPSPPASPRLFSLSQPLLAEKEGYEEMPRKVVVEIPVKSRYS